MSVQFPFHFIKAEREERISDVIQRDLPDVEMKLIDELLYIGGIYVDFKRCRENRIVSIDSIVRVHLHPRRFPAAHIDWKKCIVEDNDDFVLINKPNFVPTHPTLDNVLENASAMVAKTLGREIYVTHRLDNDTQGLLLLAKTKEFQRFYNALIAKREIVKYYRAMVQKTFEPQIFVDYMMESKKAPRIMSHMPNEKWRECRLEILESEKISYNFDDLYCLKINLLTGRPHQIRAQLALHGAPILADIMYASTWNKKENFFGLQSFYLEFRDHKKRLHKFTLDFPWNDLI
jgi:23S rRNA pseudouridine1911/1915/1917 synthase